jgi:hypothetical protein
MSRNNIKLSDRLYYYNDNYGPPFLHVNENGYFCGYIRDDNINKICNTCGFKLSKEEKFIIKLWEFNE